jgi:hypothetical protein
VVCCDGVYRNIAVLIRPVALALAIALTTAVAGCGDGESGGDVESGGGEQAEPVPSDTRSGPGTALPDGLTVASGSSLIGPAVVDGVDASGRPTSWFALVLVEGDPLEVWRAYAGQIAELFPDEDIDPDRTPGCLPIDAESEGEVCDLSADTVGEDGGVRRERRADARMVSVPGDVTGRYLLHISASSATGDDVLGDYNHGGGDPFPGGDLPEPQEPRPRPAVGEPLAPRTIAYEGDNEEYVVLEGSELIAQYGAGSITGGFAVLLRVTAGADVGSVAAAYADQANQFEGEPMPEPEVVEHDGATVTRYLPPGGAGGYTGEVTAVDQASGDGYIFYSLAND